MKRSVLGLMYFIQGMRNAGIAVDEKLDALGIQPDSFNPNSIIHDKLEWEIMHHLCEDVFPEKGLYIGQHYALAGYGPFLMLLVTCDCLGTAFKKGIEFQKLTHLFGVLYQDMQEHQVIMYYRSKDNITQVGQLRTQCEISGTFKFLKDIFLMMGLRFPELRVELPFPAPIDPQLLLDYQNYYGEHIIFNAKQAAFIFSKDILGIAIPSVDMITHRVYLEKCQLEIDRLNQKDEPIPDIVQCVQDYLDLQKGIIPNMTEIAHALNMSERTLRHQLQQLNTSYSQIREQSIKRKALALMQQKQYSIEKIAELLGYSETAAFNHAFKRWFGRSPRQYEK